MSYEEPRYINPTLSKHDSHRPSCPKCHRTNRAAAADIVYYANRGIEMKYLCDRCGFKRINAPNSPPTLLASAAYAAVKKAIQVGDLIRPEACEQCGDTNGWVQAAHYDYSRPLDIRWLCVPCHIAWDRAVPKGGTIASQQRLAAVRVLV